MRWVSIAPIRPNELAQLHLPSLFITASEQGFAGCSPRIRVRFGLP